MLVHQAHIDLLGSKWHGAVESLVVCDMFLHLQLFSLMITEVSTDILTQVQFVLTYFVNDQIGSDNLGREHSNDITVKVVVKILVHVKLKLWILT